MKNGVIMCVSYALVFLCSRWYAGFATCGELAAAAYLEMSWRERRKKTQEA